MTKEETRDHVEHMMFAIEQLAYRASSTHLEGMVCTARAIKELAATAYSIATNWEPETKDDDHQNDEP